MTATTTIGPPTRPKTTPARRPRTAGTHSADSERTAAPRTHRALAASRTLRAAAAPNATARKRSGTVASPCSPPRGNTAPESRISPAL
eukprot:10727106-Heterocapsa_arctica.AAC.1